MISVFVGGEGGISPGTLERSMDMRVGEIVVFDASSDGGVDMPAGDRFGEEGGDSAIL